MKKPILVALLMIILAVILLPQEIEIEEAADPIIIREVGLIHWLWALASLFVGVIVGMFIMGLCGSAKMGDLDLEITARDLTIERRDIALNECKKTLERIQKETIKNKFIQITSSNIVEHLSEKEFTKLFKWIAENCPDEMLGEIDNDYIRNDYLKVDQEIADAIESQIADKILKRR